MADKNKDNPFLLGLSITLGTIVIGLISFLIYTNQVSKEPLRCEYNGWAYADGEIYDSTDGCNTCFCNDGKTVCTEKACAAKTCTFEGNTYKEGESFQSSDGCNMCGCMNGEVTCTLMACDK
ncbi:MAG TPA: hypothetical protein PLA45_00725 [Candidatus Dojkabacteria bacterium]|nr:hypothetical protein [Candidatus Dojkabacteria bacterium]HOR05878.1 hypothetical protein [Candidatus Dojkabacteria bacterium]